MAKELTLSKGLFFRLDAHYRLLISLAVSALVFFFIHNSQSVPAVILLTWISFALVVIIMDWIIILWSHPREVRKIAKLQDSSRTFIFLFVIAASLMSMVAILFLLMSTKGLPPASVSKHIFLAITAVIISWWLVHSVFTLRYAHMYYDTDTDDGKPVPVGGLEFPGKEDPDYLDFVYFSFVLGMTFQVSDVEISAREIRRWAWLHGLLSFAFNTAIVALSINVISGMVAK
jgi:uncharacterized membrane protein